MSIGGHLPQNKPGHMFLNFNDSTGALDVGCIIFRARKGLSIERVQIGRCTFCCVRKKVGVIEFWFRKK